MTQELDLHASIKWLAEIEVRPVLDVPYPSDTVVNLESGCIAPFAALRVPCIFQTVGDDMGRARHFHIGIGWADGCPGWEPVQDVRVACWEVFKLLPNRIKRDIADAPFRLSADAGVNTWEEAVLRAAKAWLKEKP